MKKHIVKALKFSVASTIFAMLMACGGGGDSEPSGIESNLSDLKSVLGAASSKGSVSLCGHDVGTSTLKGVVSGVHDGDTITVNGSRVRLDSIDAPELNQTYGPQSQANLYRLLIGKSVTVAYAKIDTYGRIIGAVFTDSCQYANLEQVKGGFAWFYRTYQCEISASDRQLFDQSESNAKALRSGLWANASAVAPWVFRNGFPALVPVCSSSTPAWS